MQAFGMFLIIANALFGAVALAQSIYFAIKKDRDASRLCGAESTAFFAFAVALMAMFPNPGVTP